MGYTTEFNGSLKLNPPATPELVKYINTLSSTRRMKRDVAKLQELYNGEHGFNGSYGTDGEFFVKDDGNFGQTRDSSIIDYNQAPLTQPGLWCQWILSEDGTKLEWDGNEKFYNYSEWLNYLNDKFLAPNGITLEGEIEWQGEEEDDQGAIIATIAEVKNEPGEVIGHCTQIKTEIN